MTKSYVPNELDRRLCSDFYRVYRGQRIDIRWSGGWLTPDGVYYPVDYKNGVTHETLAEEHGRKIRGSGSVMSTPPMIRLFDHARWMRITFLEPSSFCVELRGSLIDPYCRSPEERDQRQVTLLRFVRHQDFDAYFLNNRQFNRYRDFVAAIRNDDLASI